MFHAGRSRRGGNAIEFALLLPLYLLITFGTVEFGWTMYHLTALHSAAHHGCRRATLLDPGVGEAAASAVLATATQSMEDHFDSHGPGCPSSGCSSEAALTGAVPQRSLVCRIAAPLPPLLGFVPGPSELRATAVMRLEFQRGT